MGKYLLPLFAIISLCFAGMQIAHQEIRPPLSEPDQPLATSPFASSIAAAGIVEPRSGRISIGTTIAGVVSEVFVEVGQEVEVGDPLFRVDDRVAKTEHALAQAQLQRARASLARLKNLPRPEEINIAKLKLAEAEATLWSATTNQESSAPAISINVARAKRDTALSELNLLQRGSWKYDLAIQETEVAQAEKEVELAVNHIEKHIVRAKQPGTILSLRIKQDEFLANTSGPAVILGDCSEIHVRVEIDEYVINQFDSGAKAFAVARGNSARIPLVFVRTEPMVVPKHTLTGNEGERIDTRVMQVIYRVNTTDNLKVGQQVDIYIDLENSSGVREE